MRERNILRERRNSPRQFSNILFLTDNTEEQNTQGFTETLSQPISQSITANLSWKASVNSVCRRPSVSSKCAPKGSVNSVRSVREKPSQRERKKSQLRVSNNLSLTENHRRTELTKVHRDIKSTDNSEPYSQHASPNTLLLLIINTQQPSPNTRLLLIINTQQPSPNTHHPIRQSHYSKLARLAFVKINDNLRGSGAQDDVRTAHM